MPGEKEKKTIADPEIYNQMRHRDQGYKRVAALTAVLCKAEAVRLLQTLTKEEAEGLLRELVGLGPLTAKEMENLLEEFGYNPLVRNPSPAGGEAVAAELALEAFGG